MLKFEPAQRSIAGEVLTSIMEALKRRHVSRSDELGTQDMQLCGNEIQS